MRTISSFVLTLLFCDICSGQNWQDEKHVWNEEKGRFEVHNKAHGRIVEDKRGEFKFQPPTEEWARYLPRTVRYGKREATSWEISEAQRKLWAKGILQQRAMQKAEQRRQLIAHRKKSGWYDERYKQGIRHGSSAYTGHMQNVSRYRY